MSKKYLSELAVTSAAIALMPMFASVAYAEEPSRSAAASTESDAAADGASEAAKSDGGEILVTARRREERLGLLRLDHLQLRALVTADDGAAALVPISFDA